MKATILRVDSASIHFRSIEMVRGWCKLPYPGHHKGCPNSNLCGLFRNDIEDRVRNSTNVHLIWVEFDLDEQERSMKDKHPSWTSRQCRNLLYWQRSVRKELKDTARSAFPGRELIIGAEGGGVDFYLTMKKLGIPLDSMRDLHIVRVIGIVLGNDTKTKKLTEWM